MTEQPDRKTRENATDRLHWVFAGFNEAHAASILGGEILPSGSDGNGGTETDFEYTGLLLDPDFEVEFAPGVNGHEEDLIEDEVDAARNVDESTDGEPESETEAVIYAAGSPDDGDPISTNDGDVSTSPATASVVSEAGVSVDQIVRIERMISAIRADGHHAADVDPLGMMPRSDEHLHPDRFGVLPETLAASSRLLAEANDEIRPWLAQPTIGEAIEELKSSYCATIGYEFDHVHSVRERRWLQDQVENQSAMQFMTDSQKRYQLELLTKVDGFEKYLHATFPGKRWYGLEGLDALVPLIDQIVLQSAFNVKQIVMGMPHRGRLNVLAHLLEQPYASLLTGFLEGRFAHLAAMEAAGWMTDVKYHLGSRADVDVNQDGMTDITLRLLPNPSHLEMVDPVVLGAVKGRARRGGRTRRSAP